MKESNRQTEERIERSKRVKQEGLCGIEHEGEGGILHEGGKRSREMKGLVVSKRT